MTIFLVVFISIFIAAICEKFAGGIDTTVDFLKLTLVWMNLIIMSVLLYQKNFFYFGILWQKVLLSFGIVTLYSLCMLNLFILILDSMSTDDKPNNSFLPYSYDFLTLGITLGNDILYLVIYHVFQSRRALIATVTLIIIEFVIFASCANTGSDEAIDTANAVLSLITFVLALMLWSAKVSLNSDGTPLEFKDYFERDDLDDDHLNLVEGTSNKETFTGINSDSV